MALVENAPRMTIVIPTLNRSALVGRAIESAMAQTLPDIEILVSNNGSTDDTRAVLKRYEGAPRVRILHRDQTIPMNDHATFLVNEARGHFFLGLSDDDWLEPGMAARAVDRFEKDSTLTFVWTGCWIHYADVRMPAPTGPDVETGEEFLRAFLGGSRNPCWCACITRAADLRRLGPQPDGVICGDMFYWTKLAAEGRVGCILEPLSHYVCYRDSGDGVAGGAHLENWTRDQARWVRDMLLTCRAVGPWSGSPVAIERDAARFMARTIAAQFVWNALRGKDRLDLAKSVPPHFPFLVQGELRNWIAVMASLMAPKWLLRNRVLAEVSRRARARADQRFSPRSGPICSCRDEG